MNDPVLLSVVIPVWNRGKTVVETLRSIAGLHAAPCEVIIVDDGSTDETADQLEAAIAEDGLADRARVIRQANAGPSAARNTGAAAARGTWLAFLDSDDIWFPWTLKTLLALLHAQPQPALIFLQTTVETAPALPDSPMPDADSHDSFLDAFMAMWHSRNRRVITGSCNMVIDRASFDGLGGFNTGLWHSEDIDLFIRAHSIPCVLVHSPHMLRYATEGADNLSANIPKMMQAIRHFDQQYRQNAAKLFGDKADMFREYFSGIIAYGIRRAFANGYPGSAYSLLLRYRSDLLGRQARRWPMVARMVATPLLAILRPQNYSFRLKPLK